MAKRWYLWIIAGVLIFGVAVLFQPAGVEHVTANATGQPVPTSSEIASSDSLAKLPIDVESDTPLHVEDASLLNAQALNAWHTGDIAGAMTLFEQAIEADPDDPKPHSDYGRLLTLMVSYEKALPLLERARDLKPDDAQLWLDLATLYERVQAFDKSWAARAEASRLLGPGAISRDEQGRFIVEGTSLW